MPEVRRTRPPAGQKQVGKFVWIRLVRRGTSTGSASRTDAFATFSRAWYGTRLRHENLFAGVTVMRNVRLLAAAALGFFVMAQEATAQRRGGGAGGGGRRGAMVGGMVGGSEGAAKGAKIGVVTGATRSAIGRESEMRNQYQTSTAYQNVPRSNFTEAPPQVLRASEDAEPPTNPSGEAVIRRNDRPIVGITFPADWKQSTGPTHISATSKDGQAYAMVASLEKIADNNGG